MIDKHHVDGLRDRFYFVEEIQKIKHHNEENWWNDIINIIQDEGQFMCKVLNNQQLENFQYLCNSKFK